VDAVVEGSVLRYGDSVSMSVRLIAVSPERQLWGDSYRGTLTSVPAIVGEVARSIASRVEADADPRRGARQAGGAPVDPDAYEAYMRGLFNLDRRNREGLMLADRYLSRSVEIDSTFAPAYAALAEVRGSAAFFGLRAPTETLPGVQALVETALALDSTLAIGHARRAAVRLYGDWDWEGAERSARRALELNPSLAEGHRILSEILAVQGRYDEALVEVERGSELDRWSQFSAFRPAVVLYYMRRFDEAARRARSGLEFFPDFWQGHWLLCLSLDGSGASEAAVAECREAVRLSGRASMALGALGYALARNGQMEQARAVVRELSTRAEEAYVAPTDIAMVHVAMQDPDAAFLRLEQAYRVRDITLVHLRDHAFFDGLRDDPRLDGLLERLGLTGPA
jgi:tetratricopeptide (TPR) repeat protein